MAAAPLDEKGNALPDAAELARKRGRRKRQDCLIDCTDSAFHPRLDKAFRNTGRGESSDMVKDSSLEPPRKR